MDRGASVHKRVYLHLYFRSLNIVQVEVTPNGSCPVEGIKRLGIGQRDASAVNRPRHGRHAIGRHRHNLMRRKIFCRRIDISSIHTGNIHRLHSNGFTQHIQLCPKNFPVGQLAIEVGYSRLVGHIIADIFQLSAVKRNMPTGWYAVGILRFGDGIGPQRHINLTAVGQKVTYFYSLI